MYKQVKCPKGHSFRAYFYNRHQKIECPECRRNMRENVDSGDSFYSPSFTFDDVGITESTPSYSGGGGSFGGGGASGSWDSGSSSDSSSSDGD